MRQDFSEVARGGHWIFDFRLAIFDWNLAENLPLNRKSTI
jgi:hypothetical protein